MLTFNNCLILNYFRGFRNHSAIFGFNHFDNHILFALAAVPTTATEATTTTEAATTAVSTAKSTGVTA